jgi:cysteinyl-tRNA synthetase
VPSDFLEIALHSHFFKKSLEVRKKAKDFALADKIRDEIDALGYKIVDDRSGSRVERK